MTTGLLLHRTAIRLLFCAVPFLIAALALERVGDPRLLRSPLFWLVVVAVPAAGLLIDLGRLSRTRPQSSERDA